MTKEDVIKFFRSSKCEDCPFKEECGRVYDLIRSHSSSAFTICDAITMDEETYNTFNEW